jgi:hypothetical protein
LAGEHGVERIEIGEIDAPRHEHGVVEADALDRTGADRPELGRDLVAQRLARAGVDRVAHRDALGDALGLVAWMRLERRIHPRVERGPESAQDLLILPSRHHLLRGRGLTPGQEEPLRSAGADEVGEALVEDGTARRVKRVVGELVNDGIGKRQRVGAQRGREEGVVEPAERAERRGRAKTSVESLRHQVAFGGSGRAEIEVALVWNSPHDRKPPRPRPEPVAVGTRKHEYERVAIEMAERREALAGS